MSNKKLRLLLILEVFVAAAALIFVVVVFWNKPLGPSIELPTTAPGQGVNSSQTPVASVGDTGSGLEPTPTDPSVLSQIVALLHPPATASATLCNGPSVMTILLVGSDERQDDYLYGLADSIRIVRIDFATPKVTLLDIPRDLWVEIPGISDHYGITHGKLNQAYFFGNPGMDYYDGPGEGPGLLAQTLELNFGLRVDHYLAMDMKTFVNLIDTVGGIDIYVNSKVDFNAGQDGANPDLVYEPGYYHLDGTQALRLARDRHPTIFQRARYQSMVLSALENKLLSPEVIPVWPQIIAQFTHSVQSDLSPNDISKLVCIGQSLTKDNTTMVAFPDDMFASGSIYDPYRKVYTYILEADFNQIRTYITDFMNGIWP
ncbi:MAG: LCP family protein [Anaerolineales bacterium]